MKQHSSMMILVCESLGPRAVYLNFFLTHPAYKLLRILPWPLFIWISPVVSLDQNYLSCSRSMNIRIIPPQTHLIFYHHSYINSLQPIIAEILNSFQLQGQIKIGNSRVVVFILNISTFILYLTMSCFIFGLHLAVLNSDAQFCFSLKGSLLACSADFKGCGRLNVGHLALLSILRLQIQTMSRINLCL